MVNYKNEEYLKYEIMGQSRHQFIYGYDNEKRKSFFHKLDGEYPIKIDCNSPMAICLNEFGLPKVPLMNDELDNNKIDILAREYLSFAIAHAILQKSKKTVDIDLLNSKLIRLFNLLNKYSVNPGQKEINSLDELISILNESKEFYMSYYLNYVKTGKEDKSIDNIVMPFLQLEFFVSQYKKALDNGSYFAIVIDKCDDISLASTRAVNFLVGSRINSDISMKIVVEPEKWDSYIDTNGQCVEAIHDYGIIELDHSQIEYIKRLKKL